MGNTLVKKLGKGEHCHRRYNEDGTKYIIICKNQKCIEHYCFDGECKKDCILVIGNITKAKKQL